MLMPDEGETFSEFPGAASSGSLPPLLEQLHVSSPYFQSYKELFNWPDVFLAKLEDKCSGAYQELLRKLRQGVAVVTDYSGVGSPEIALEFIVQALQKRCGQSDDSAGLQLRCLYAADADAQCRRVLLSHSTGVAAPCCVLGNMLERCPQSLLLECEQMLDDYREQADNAITQGQVRRTVMENFGQEFVREACKLMFKSGQEQRTWCFRHQTSQCVQERPDRQAPRGHVTLAVAGVTCVDWSALGQRSGWLGDSVLPFLAWARQRKLQKETIIVIECTPGFDDETVASIFSEYSSHTFEICPSMLGVPATRRRKYQILLLKSELEMRLEVPHMYFFKEVFGQAVQVDGKHFACAPESMVKTSIERAAKRRGFPARNPLGHMWKPKTLLPSALRDRVRDWEDLVRTEYGLEKDQVTTAYMNVTQNAERCPTGPYCPALITRSNIWSFRALLLLSELAEIQGLAVLTASDYACPFRDLVLQSDLGEVEEGEPGGPGELPISDAHMRRMLGNGMSMTCIGATLLMALAASLPTVSASAVSPSQEVQEGIPWQEPQEEARRPSSSSASQQEQQDPKRRRVWE